MTHTHQVFELLQYVDPGEMGLEYTYNNEYLYYLYIL